MEIFKGIEYFFFFSFKKRLSDSSIDRHSVFNDIFIRAMILRIRGSIQRNWKNLIEIDFFLKKRLYRSLLISMIRKEKREYSKDLKIQLDATLKRL